jgi:hypothetical protein
VLAVVSRNGWSVVILHCALRHTLQGAPLLAQAPVAQEDGVGVLAALALAGGPQAVDVYITAEACVAKATPRAGARKGAKSAAPPCVLSVARDCHSVEAQAPPAGEAPPGGGTGFVVVNVAPADPPGAPPTARLTVSHPSPEGAASWVYITLQRLRATELAHLDSHTSVR